MPLLISAIVIVLIIAPYLFAVGMNSDGLVFEGFLINPIDGHSYLAKMQQGFRGEWRFELPYTANAGSGAYLFLFYLGLGHLSRILGLPLIIVFHGFRIIGAILLLRVLYLFNTRIFEKKREQNIGFMVSALGSGLGWIAIFAGMFTSDFWVAEAYPFLSMYTNPHFAIGLALMILILIPDRKTSLLVELVFGISLGVIQPFAVVIVLVVRTGSLIFEMIEGDNSGRRILNSPEIFPTAVFGLGGGAVLLYQYLSIISDPVLSLWNAQNITQSPRLIDLAISLSPALVFAALGLKKAWEDNRGRRLVIWAASSLILVLIPWNLQRRFLTGIYVPLAGLSIYGLVKIRRAKEEAYRQVVIALLVLAIPTNVIVIASGIQAAAKRDPKIYGQTDIYTGLEWIGEYASEEALILASEDVGLLIPSTTGRNVIYGHPFETVNAEQEKQFLKDILEKDQEAQFYNQNILLREVDYLFLNRDVSKSLERWLADSGVKLEYENSLVRIFRVGQ